jgi:hypothetical protein
VLQLIGILFLLDENKKIAEELEKNSPPFWFDKSTERWSAHFDPKVNYVVY